MRTFRTVLAIAFLLIMLNVLFLKMFSPSAPSVQPYVPPAPKPFYPAMMDPAELCDIYKHRTPQVMNADERKHFDKTINRTFSKADIAVIDKGIVHVGVSAKVVECLLGKPVRKVRSDSAYLGSSEMWVFAGGAYVHFDEHMRLRSWTDYGR